MPKQTSSDWSSRVLIYTVSASSPLKSSDGGSFTGRTSTITITESHNEGVPLSQTVISTVSIPKKSWFGVMSKQRPLSGSKLISVFSVIVTPDEIETRSPSGSSTSIHSVAGVSSYMDTNRVSV